MRGWKGLYCVSNHDSVVSERRGVYSETLTIIYVLDKDPNPISLRSIYIYIYIYISMTMSRRSVYYFGFL